MRPVMIRCCKCGSKAAIESSKEISDLLKQLYCCCRNPECGHTFVVNMEFSHTLSPSALDLPEALRQRIQEVTPAMQGQLFG